MLQLVGLLVGLDSCDDLHQLLAVGLKVALTAELGVVHLAGLGGLDFERTRGGGSRLASDDEARDVGFQGGFHRPELGSVPSSTTVRNVNVRGHWGCRHLIAAGVGFF